MNASLLAILTLFGADAMEAQRPYELTVCIRVADHPLLTDLFRDTIREQTQDHLNHLFGPLATVNVKTSGHWLLDDNPHQALDGITLGTDAAADRPLDEHTTLMFVDYHGPDYVVSWRHIDGRARIVGPLHRRRTLDRQWVAKAICLAIRDDFPVKATVVQKYLGEATLTFSGGVFQERLSQLLGEHCVMQLYEVTRRGSQVSRRRLRYSLLVWEREKGPLRASIVSNERDPLRPRPGVSFEAVKVPTVPGRLRLTLRDAESGRAMRQCIVAVGDQGFDEIDDADLLSPDRYGVVVSAADQSLNHIAYVRITQGAAVVRLALPITDEITEYEVPLPANPHAMAAEDVDRTLRLAGRDLRLMLGMQTRTREQVNQLLNEKRYEEARQLTADCGDNVKELLVPVVQEVNSQRVEMQRNPQLQSQAQQIERLERDIDKVKSRGVDLEGQLKDIEAVIATNNARSRANVLVSRARDAVHTGDIDQAIEHYTAALEQYAELPEVAAELARLQRHWTITPPDAAHQRARDFVYERFASASTDDIADLLPRIEEQFAVLEERGDHLTATKLVSILGERLNDVAELLDVLTSRTESEAASELERYQELQGKLDALYARVEEFIQKQLDVIAAEEVTPEPTTPPLSPTDSRPSEADSGGEAIEPTPDAR